MLRLKVLGGLGVEGDEAPVIVAGTLRRPLLLLALLAVAGDRGVPREQILIYFWGDSPETQARSSLRQTLFRLRRDLATPELVLGTSELRLNPAVITSDVAEFGEAFRTGDHARAAALYGGALLAQIQARGLPEFEQWLSVERARLEQCAVEAHTELAEAAAARGDHAAALQWARRLARLDPMSSAAAAVAIGSLAALADRAAAIRHGRAYETLLQRELGAVPDDRIRALMADLLDPAPAVRTTPAGGAPPAGGAALPPPPPPPTAHLPDLPDLTPATPPRPTQPAWWRERPRLVVVVAALLAVVAFGTARLAVRAGDGPLGHTTIVVAPFDVLDPELAVWGEGMSDVLSRNLDGAGPLHAVPPTVAVRHFEGHADRASAIELGQRTGAGLAIYGTVMRAGADSVRASLAVVEVPTGRVLGDVHHHDAVVRMDRLTDSLTVGALRALGARLPIAAVRRSSLGWRLSVDALRNFLQAEQFYRRAQWDSAEAAYLRVIDRDSTFALPYRRIGHVLGWKRVAVDRQAGAYHLRAGTLNHGLGPRDSLLVAADSLGAAARVVAERPLAALALVRRQHAALEEAARLYPNDPEVWFALGELRYHAQVGPGVLVPEREQLAAFERAIALDSAFAPAYIHTTELALASAGLARGLALARAYLALNPTEPSHRGVRLVERILTEQARAVERDGGPPATLSPELRQLLDTADADALVSARSTLRRFVDPAESAVYVGRLLAAGRPSPYPLFADTAHMRRRLAETLAFRGHLREAYAVLGDRELPIFAELAQLGAVPPARARAVLGGWLARESPLARLALPWWAAAGDTVALGLFLRRVRRPDTGQPPGLAAYDAAAGAAYLALARADSAGAARLFATLPDSVCAECYVHRLTKARLHEARGDPATAAALLDETLVAFLTPYEVVFAVERARVALALGRQAEARTAYEFAARAWLRADPALRPQLDSLATRVYR